MTETATAVKDAAAAPASTPAPDTASTPAAGPTSAREAVEAAFTKASDPASSAGTEQPPTPPDSAAVAEPPAAGQPPAGGQGNTPEASQGIAQLRSAYDALKSRYAWAENMDPRRVANVMQEWERFETDPVAWYRQLGNELTGDPRYKEGVAPPAQVEPEPQPDLYTMVDGERVPVFSAKQQQKWREWNDKRIDKRMEDRLNPMQKWVNEARTTAERNEIVAGARTTATEVLSELRQYPHFKEGEAKIAERLSKMNPVIKSKIGSIAALHLAYTQYLKEDVFPTLDAKTEERVRADFSRKAAASSGSVVPGSGAQTGTGQRPSNISELANKMASGAYGKS